MKKIITQLSLLFFIPAVVMAGIINFDGGTWTIIQIHGNPIEVVQVDLQGDDIMLYKTKDGKESFVSTSNVKNLGELEQMVSKSLNIENETTATSNKTGQIKKDLGTRSLSFGSSGQASELLALINSDHDKTDYQISYTTEIDTILFGCNLDKEVIIRIHQRPDGHGQQEMWSGYVMYRLRAAAAGRSLNDTPQGKIMGLYQSF